MKNKHDYHKISPEQQPLMGRGLKQSTNKRREFLKQVTLSSIGAALLPLNLKAGSNPKQNQDIKPLFNRITGKTIFNKEHLQHIAFPIGGLGAGMFCLEGYGALSHFSIRNHPEIFNEPGVFAAIAIQEGSQDKVTAKVLEGPVPNWKIFGPRDSGLGDVGRIFGLPRFREASFESSFPFGEVHLKDQDFPIDVIVEGWSPFIPGDQDNSGLPCGTLTYKIRSKSKATLKSVFSFNAKNFLATDAAAVNKITPMKGGFILRQEGAEKKAFLENDLAIYTSDPAVKIDHCWFRGNWFDPLTITWDTISQGKIRQVDPVDKSAAGASLYIPFTLAPGQEKKLQVHLNWYSPYSNLTMGEQLKGEELKTASKSEPASDISTGKKNDTGFYRPWYSARFGDIEEVADYWITHYEELRAKTNVFNKTFYASTLPSAVIEAVTANLSILKSPTVLRQYDGRLWCWEGSGDDFGSCHGSCTHVWNYAQATAHLFPALERSLRQTEFHENQDSRGHQTFRANLPISPTTHSFHAAADGQLGGIMKVYRDWHILGDAAWLKAIFPKVKTSLDYCITTWDPKGKGVIEEPHHNTYDIEFWGPDGMLTSFYLGALKAFIEMATYLKESTDKYQELLKKGTAFLENQLFNKEYFIQKIEYKNLQAKDPTNVQSFGGAYSAEATALLQKEGPKYQYGNGCLSDGILGAWIGKMCGLEDFVNPSKVQSHLLAVYKYNLKSDLWQHANPQRPGFALDGDGGLLLCSWPKGGKLSLPFVYSDEVWTGIEYQVASHLMGMGKVKEGLDVIKCARGRYDGRIRNPFNEYECGHFYGRALSSYGLIQGLTGLRYDAVDRTLHIQSQIGDFTCFLATNTGFGTVTFKGTQASLKVAYGKIPVNSIIVNGEKMS